MVRRNVGPAVQSKRSSSLDVDGSALTELGLVAAEQEHIDGDGAPPQERTQRGGSEMPHTRRGHC